MQKSFRNPNPYPFVATSFERRRMRQHAVARALSKHAICTGEHRNNEVQVGSKSKTKSAANTWKERWIAELLYHATWKQVSKLERKLLVRWRSKCCTMISNDENKTSINVRAKQRRQCYRDTTSGEKRIQRLTIGWIGVYRWIGSVSEWE